MTQSQLIYFTALYEQETILDTSTDVSQTQFETLHLHQIPGGNIWLQLQVVVNCVHLLCGAEQVVCRDYFAENSCLLW